MLKVKRILGESLRRCRVRVHRSAQRFVAENKNPVTRAGFEVATNNYQVVGSGVFALICDCRITSVVSPAIQGPSACQ